MFGYIIRKKTDIAEYLKRCGIYLKEIELQRIKITELEDVIIEKDMLIKNLENEIQHLSFFKNLHTISGFYIDGCRSEDVKKLQNDENTHHQVISKLENIIEEKDKEISRLNDISIVYTDVISDRDKEIKRLKNISEEKERYLEEYTSEYIGMTFKVSEYEKQYNKFKNEYDSLKREKLCCNENNLLKSEIEQLKNIIRSLNPELEI